MSGNQAYLDNTMLGETVIYCDEKSDRYPAFIIHPISDTLVDLVVINRTTGVSRLVNNVPFNHSIEATPNTWYRRNKM